MEVKLPFRPLYLDQPKDELEEEISEEAKQLKRENGELRDDHDGQKSSWSSLWLCQFEGGSW